MWQTTCTFVSSDRTIARCVSRSYVLRGDGKQPLVEQLVHAGLRYLHAVFERLGRLCSLLRDDLLVALEATGQLDDVVVLVLDLELAQTRDVEKRPQLAHVDELRGDGFEVLEVLDEEFRQVVE